MTFVDVAAAADVPPGRMVHVEAAGREILLANVNGEFHAVATGAATRARSSPAENWTGQS